MACAACLLLLLLDPVPSAERAYAQAANIAALAAPRYAVREAAAKRLVEGGGKRALRAAANSPDPEVAARARACLAAIVEAEVEALRPLPEIDAAWRCTKTHSYGLPAVPELWHILIAVGPTSRPFDGYYAATEAWVRRLLVAGWSPKGLRPILAEMHRRDADFLERLSDPDDGPWPVDAEAYLRGGK